MLQSLSIKNFALIDDLNVHFNKGLTIITGETGAGKSILLGGLSLILGKRADLSSLRDKERKCVIEAEFRIEHYDLEPFFKSEDIEFENLTIIRREILPSGKSRAFINDSPVNLNVLSELGEKLIDIHSQHQTLQLTDNLYQFQVIDAVAGNASLLGEYSLRLSEYRQVKKALEKLINFQQEADKEHDYNVFLLNELKEAKLQEGMQQELEEVYEKLSNVEEIAQRISHAHQLIGEEQIGTLSGMNELRNIFQKLEGYGKQFSDLAIRMNSMYLELDDAFSEIQKIEESLEADPQLLEEVSGKLQQLYNLQKKHNAMDVAELLQIQQTLDQKVAVTENLENDIREKQLQLLEIEARLDEYAEEIRNKRIAASPELISYLESTLAELGMANARFRIDIQPSATYRTNGKDELSLLFSANKGSSFDELKKVASGGELSRIMLSIKSLLSRYMDLPTIMFDEIDTGVSGEVSNKMGDIMLQMSKAMQVFTITHLPQVASKGDSHFKIFKEDEGEVTSTKIRLLNSEERVVEIAEMLGGKDLSKSALEHAKQLLN